MRIAYSSHWVTGSVGSDSKALPGNIVPHPRYGSMPIPSGIVVSEKDICFGYWGFHKDRIFPESVLLADAGKQNFALYPRKYFVDILRTCRSCGRPFIFFAREQRYWYETLKFFVDANCIHCSECRRSLQAQRRRLRRHSDLLAKPRRTDVELMHLVDDGAFLLAASILRNASRLGQLKNEALKRIPDYKGTKALEAALMASRHATDIGD